MTQIIEIAEFRLKRNRRMVTQAGCKHNHLTLDDEGEFVTCDDCKMQVGTYAALRMLVDRWDALQGRADAQRRALEVAAETTLATRAALRVEQAWRSRSMAPTCPHCNEAIYATDGFGGAQVSREIAERRRACRTGLGPCAGGEDGANVTA